MSSSRGSSRPRDRTRTSVSPALSGRFFTTVPPEKSKKYISVYILQVYLCFTHRIRFLPPRTNFHKKKSVYAMKGLQYFFFFTVLKLKKIVGIRNNILSTSLWRLFPKQLNYSVVSKLIFPEVGTILPYRQSLPCMGGSVN